MNSIIEENLKSISFNNVEYFFTNSEKQDSLSNNKSEYLLPNELISQFSHKFCLEINDKESDLTIATKLKVKELLQRKKSDLKLRFDMVENPEGTEIIIDYLKFEPSKNYVEYNVEKYKVLTLSEEKKVISIYRYTSRSYENDIPSFVQYITENKGIYIDAMRAFNL